MDNPTNVAQQEEKEVQDIIVAIEDHIWYNQGGGKLNPTRTKSGETIAALIKVLVGKGVIDSQDVRRILGVK